MKTISLSDILSSNNGKECANCKEIKSFDAFYLSNSKRKRKQRNNLFIHRMDYKPEAYQHKLNTIQTDVICKACRKNQVKKSKDSSMDKKLAEIINNFWDFHYNKYPEVANYFPGYGDFDNNPIKNTGWNRDKNPYMLNLYTYMFFFQFHNNSHRKRYIQIFMEKYIKEEFHNQIETSPAFLQDLFFAYRNQIPLFTIYKFCPKCKEFKQTYKEIKQLGMLLNTSRKMIHMYITPLNFQLAAFSSKNGWQRDCMECIGSFRRNTPLVPQKPIERQIRAPKPLDPIRDRDALYAQMPEEIFDPQTGEEN